MNDKENNTTWSDFPLGVRGAIIGASLWVLYLIMRYFEYFYSRYTIESLGTKIKPYLYFTPPNPLILLAALLILAGIGALIGYGLNAFRTSRK